MSKQRGRAVITKSNADVQVPITEEANTSDHQELQVGELRDLGRHVEKSSEVEE